MSTKKTREKNSTKHNGVTPGNSPCAYLYQHTHEFSGIGSISMGDSRDWFHPIFQCEVCGDIMIELLVNQPEGQNCPDTKCIRRALHNGQHFNGRNKKWD